MKIKLSHLLVVGVLCFLLGKMTGGFAFQNQTREAMAEYKGKVDTMMTMLSPAVQSDIALALANTVPAEKIENDLIGYGTAAAQPAINHNQCVE